jgi:SMODS and SLOG-associating 2TM effector domain 1/SMODS and SLOG-associating 2TM effector domain 3
MEPNQQQAAVNFERELQGPYAYDRFNKISLICQSNYVTLIKIQNVVLIFIALFAACPPLPQPFELWRRCLVIAQTVFTLGAVIYQQNKSFMKGWQNTRFIAESVLTNAWLFSFKIGIYNTDEKKAKSLFIDTADEIKSKVDIKSFYAYYDPELPHIADWMEEYFNKTIPEKKAIYIKYRLDDQIRWYTRKAQFNGRQSEKWFTISWLLMVGSIILATLTLIKVIPQYAFLAFFATIISTIQTWKQTKRFDELKVTYAVAANELRSIKGKFELVNDEQDILKFVEEAEKSISREHKLWFNWTYIS